MHTSNLPAIRPKRPAWNKGRLIGQKRPPLPKHVWAICVRLEISEKTRDLALFNMAVDSKLRGCDLVKLKVADVYAAGQMKERASVLQSKTQKPVRFEITEGTQKSVSNWLKDPLMVGSEYLGQVGFTSRFTSPQGNTHGWYVIGWHQSDWNQLLLGHTKMDSTVRYLGVELEDTLAISEAVEI